ncbi:hypothetical protein A2631_00430 [Candidatus Daviesbacteria bacterium RIFCSPHIGHO2_01_FULL_44_29]|uniref:Uncharacterized protein n=1 Tax=Candidatus Daviesbacteria bacterium RIFCSPHIGHO2_02_FULL_43_12 TaxID=1797776 RepID=A0A1F5KJT9_9BACT|nr:MAG: hypothetical protein A2631_00430 [Candidatus Daviesbacteria bacterium RIFCSPHIGHO2_01_FULL_44_29]OGE40449.1 MAG: hypothetical protein A3E86_05630 [Candidatus Daviesbacteria bacterium RIFCSPHIGHO2_12_FULL_47_45]OGE40891.1 MAG: hypothetical protein A3D25_03140 [Candidatus Daviesbacteria bacterium RIFCSPHIGHO2_02_FULL_43_12]OGE70043.1 MAG: hypothetical protein A3B55_02490 [Candidatus Daviesbacteria bacterium RIFCSPLOWO2_01_FULL_43_15]
MATATESRIGIAVASINRGGGSNVLSLPKYTLGLNRSSVINSGDRTATLSYGEIMSQPATWQRPAETTTKPLAAIAAEVQAPHIRKTGHFEHISRRNQLLARESKNWVIDTAQKGVIKPQVAQSAKIIEQVKASSRRGLVTALGDLRRETTEPQVSQPEVIVRPAVQKVEVRQNPVILEAKFRVIETTPQKLAKAPVKVAEARQEEIQARQVIVELQKTNPARPQILWDALGLPDADVEKKKKQDQENQAKAAAVPGLLQIIGGQLVKEAIVKVQPASTPEIKQQVATFAPVTTEQLNRTVAQANPSLSPQEIALLMAQTVKKAQAAVATPAEKIDLKRSKQSSSNGGIDLPRRRANSAEVGPKFIVEDDQALGQRALHLEKGLIALSFRNPDNSTDEDLYVDGGVMKWWLYLASQQYELMHSQIVRESNTPNRFGKVKDGSLAEFINSAGKLGVLPIIKMWRRLTQANLFHRPGRWSGKDKNLLSEGEIAKITRRGEVDQGRADLWKALKDGLQTTALEIYDQRQAKRAEAALTSAT